MYNFDEIREIVVRRESAAALAAELVDPHDLRFGCADARLGILAFLAVVRLDPERANDGRQRQALQHERAENHRERQKDDQPALGEG